MRSFASVAGRYLKEMRTLSGSTVRGTIMPASDREGSPFETAAPRPVLRTAQGSEITPGTIIIAYPGGPRYLIGDHYAGEEYYRSWRLFLIEKEHVWTRPGEETDSLTNLKKAAPPANLGVALGCVEHDRRMFTDPGLRLKTERVTFITNSPIQVGDLLDGQLVTRVVRDLGLYVAEHQ